MRFQPFPTFPTSNEHRDDFVSSFWGAKIKAWAIFFLNGWAPVEHRFIQFIKCTISPEKQYVERFVFSRFLPRILWLTSEECKHDSDKSYSDTIIIGSFGVLRSLFWGSTSCLVKGIELCMFHIFFVKSFHFWCIMCWCLEKMEYLYNGREF